MDYRSYARALIQLNEQPRETVMLRVEFGFSYLEVATAIDEINLQQVFFQ